MFNRMKGLTAGALLAVAVGIPAHAATLGEGGGVPGGTILTQNVDINGANKTLSGELGVDPSSNDWIVNITSDRDATTTFYVKDPEQAPNSGEGSIGIGDFTYQLFTCVTTSGNCGERVVGGYSAVSGQLNGDSTNPFTTILLATNEYFVRVAGTEFGNGNNGYNVNVSAVPLPAAALLFMSALAGFGLLSRGKKGSTAV